MLPIQFRFADEPTTNARQNGDVNCVFSAVSQNYFLIEPLKLFPTPPRCPLLESSWDIFAPSMVTGANLPVPSLLLTWQNPTPVWKNQILSLVPVADSTITLFSPTATGKAMARVPNTTFTWAYVSEFSGSVPLTESNWVINNPDWVPCRPLPAMPLHTVTWTTAAPRIYREPNVEALKRGSVIYSVVVGGQPAIELPLSSFQARVNNANYSYLSVNVHNVEEWIDELEQRKGNYLIVKRGYRWPDGTKQLDELIRTRFDKFRYDAGARNATATLTGCYAAVPTSEQSRQLMGISYLTITDGKRRCRCEVDTFLRPGGIAIAYGQEFVVAEIVYNISAYANTMEVTEV